MRMHTRFVRACKFFWVRGFIVRMLYLPSRKVHWPNSIWSFGGISDWWKASVGLYQSYVVFSKMQVPVPLDSLSARANAGDAWSLIVECGDACRAGQFFSQLSWLFSNKSNLTYSLLHKPTTFGNELWTLWMYKRAPENNIDNLGRTPSRLF